MRTASIKTTLKKAPNSPSAQIRALAERCYEQTRGMVLYDTEESDAYWEFAEAAMQVLADARGEKLPRKDEENER